MSFPDPAGVVVSVAPTDTVVITANVRSVARASLQVDNLDGAQTFAGTIERRVADTGAWAPSTLGDFSIVAAGPSVMADVDVAGTADSRLVGTMSGAGGDVRAFLKYGASR